MVIEIIVLSIGTDYVRYWLGSIHTYSSRTAPVILVFSHAEDNNAVSQKVRIQGTNVCHISYLKLEPFCDNSTLKNDLKGIIYFTIELKNADCKGTFYIMTFCGTHPRFLYAYFGVNLHYHEKDFTTSLEKLHY